MVLAATVAAHVAMACSADAGLPLDAERADIASSGAELGRRLLQLMQENPAGQAELAGPLAYLAGSPESGRAVKAVRQRMQRLLAADPRLRARARRRWPPSLRN